ncbi:hypothetical protein ASPACDRAFT_112718 [Aspergillus aculeatus ATCC 16872]|uniref:LYC1 C-terminal domain-containing protein n=1 Tax=Aspergillus aculeatus (strain ATCC 16872 / CBS 172.66 / WB 5094) TaxID=690307 RepID=A0A1L9X742_ASPA1|nr:uncharacterized protein ASPACDRAFT_112718 [Aspergillus aculeatus ATCC 16872]OJK04270.1 hypothetical protein ASPACDRAFT_112718 [Aspergillus aculeatus ATCC 16872]
MFPSEDSLSVLSASSILAHPTASERSRIWKATYPHWGDALAFDDYITREVNNLKFCQERNNNFTNWILTDSSAPDQRPLFSSCETFTRRAFICGREGDLREVTCCAVASVFTFTEYQGRGYAKKLMTLLAQEIRGFADFSVLWSDIGPKFYDSVGWKPFKSAFLQLPAISSDASLENGLKPIEIGDLPPLVKLDQKILLERLAVPSPKVRVLILPDLSTIAWHLFHEAFIWQHVFSRTPSIHGAVYTSPKDPGDKVWAIWTRKIYGLKREDNVTHVIRLGMGNGSISNDTFKVAITALCLMAQREANDWNCGTVEIWNPDDRVRQVVEEIQELGAKFVTREHNQLSSMQWFGESCIDEVDWMCNEGFAWC